MGKEGGNENICQRGNKRYVPSRISEDSSTCTSCTTRCFRISARTSALEHSCILVEERCDTAALGRSDIAALGPDDIADEVHSGTSALGHSCIADVGQFYIAALVPSWLQCCTFASEQSGIAA